MNADITSALFGLLGVLAGGGVTLGVNALNVRAQRDQARTAREGQVTDIRRQAFVAFLTRADSFLDRTRDLMAALDLGSTDAPTDDLHQRYVEEWSQFAASSASLQIAGPAAVAVSAQKLRTTIGDLSDLVDTRYAGTRWPGGREAAVAAVRQARDDFIASAQQSLASA